jgi:hypothetical protein
MVRGQFTHTAEASRQLALHLPPIEMHRSRRGRRCARAIRVGAVHIATEADTVRQVPHLPDVIVIGGTSACEHRIRIRSVWD